MAAARVQRALAIPDQRLRQGAQLHEALADPVQEVGRLLGEDERPGASARIAKAADHDVAAPRLAGADRDLPARLPEIELQERARPVGGALEGTRPRQKQRPHLAQVVVQDRLAARVALLLQELAHPRARQPRLCVQQPVDLLTEGIELRRPRQPPIARRHGRAQRPPDRVTAVARAPDDLLDRQPLHEVQAADLRHCSTPTTTSSSLRSPRPSEAHDRPGQRLRRPQGSAFNRRGVSDALCRHDRKGASCLRRPRPRPI
jgi:hypothetical protein